MRRDLRENVKRKGGLGKLGWVKERAEDVPSVVFRHFHEFYAIIFQLRIGSSVSLAGTVYHVTQGCLI